MPDMDNDQIITANMVVDKEWIARRWNHTDAGDIRFSSQAGYSASSRAVARI
jgi:hypothetical protein